MAKTTVELPGPLLHEAKALARERGVTLRELVESGLRAELARAVAGEPFRLRVRTAGRADGPVPERPPHEYAYDDER